MKPYESSEYDFFYSHDRVKYLSTLPTRQLLAMMKRTYQNQYHFYSLSGNFRQSFYQHPDWDYDYDVSTTEPKDKYIVRREDLMEVLKHREHVPSSHESRKARLARIKKGK